MSVSKVPLINRLQLRFNTGLDEELNPIYANRSWSNVRPTISAEDLHSLGNQLGSLGRHTLEAIMVMELSELED